MRNRKNKIMIVMCIAVALMATGYAILSSKLNIRSTTMLTDSWNVRITGVTSAATGTAYNINEPTFTDTTMYFDVGVKVPGDKMTFTVTVQNAGSLDAILETIDVTVDGNSSIVYSIDGIQAQTRLLAGESKTFTVTTEFDINATSLPADPINDLIIDLVYIQDDGRSLTPIGPTMLYSLSGKILGDNKAQSDVGIDFSRPSTVISNYEMGEKEISNGENLYYYYYYAEDYEFDSITGKYTLKGDMKQALPNTIDYTKYKYSCPSWSSKSCDDMIEIISVTPSNSIFDKGKVYEYTLIPVYDDSNGKGLYYTSANTEDNKTTYYFRGLVDNNYVELGAPLYTECYVSTGQYYYMFDGDDGEYYEAYFDTKSECEESLEALDVGGPSYDAATCEFEELDYAIMLGDLDKETCESITEVCNDANSGYFPDENGNCDDDVEGLYGSLYEVDGGTYNVWYGEPYLWRIVRINEDGSVRLVLSESGGGAGFSLRDNAGVGYMYGTVGSNSYALTHANTNDSAAKVVLDKWYADTLSSYSHLMGDAGFCNDRSISTTAGSWHTSDTALGYGINTTYYGSYNRIMNLHQPQFKCPNASNDLFTLNGSSKGNKSLTYPVGMLSVDELVYAGANTTRGFYYLFDGHSYNYFLTLSPGYSKKGTSTSCQYEEIYGDDCGAVDGTFNSYEACEEAGGECCSLWLEEEIPGSCVTKEYASIYMWYMDGYNGEERGNIDFTTSNQNLRPVINLKADVKITGGDGTKNNPYVIYTK